LAAAALANSSSAYFFKSSAASFSFLIRAYSKAIASRRSYSSFFNLESASSLILFSKATFSAANFSAAAFSASIIS